MPNKKITELVDASLPLTGGEYIPIVQSGSTVKTTTDDIADLAIGDVALKDVAAIYELSVPFKQFVGYGFIAFYNPVTGGQLNPFQFISNSKAVVYKSTVDPGLVIQNAPLTQNTSLSWTVGGSLILGLDSTNTGFYFSLTNTPKIATRLEIGVGYISSINFNTERIGSLQIEPAEYQDSILDLSSLKSCTGSFYISGSAFTGKTLDISGLENWGYFSGTSPMTLNGFNNIILPTNLKTASTYDFFFNGCSFDQATVDAILQMFVDLDGTNGTQLWQGDVFPAALTLGGGNAAPSPAGLANKAILNARANTFVTTN